ncbi:MAG TPA: glycosyltransferase [Nitrospira sp.]|nr:glycosyltransferase [Nitrospira sp.]
MLLSSGLRTAEKDHGVPASGEPAYELVEEAAHLFRDTPMPLQSCLALRAAMTSAAPSSDPLTNAFRVLSPRPEHLSTEELRHLIDVGSLGGWALNGETIDFLVAAILLRRPSAVLEFGSGISSLALAWAMRRVHGASAKPYVFSIDQSPEFISRTKNLLASHGLLDDVRLLHADLVFHTIGAISARCYDLSAGDLARFFGDRRPEMVVIDGPAGEHGIRFGTVPLVRKYLAPHASIYLDDGLRDSELETADSWSRLGYVEWDGIRWIGKGLLCGTCRSEASPAIRQWHEQLLLTSRRHESALPIAPRVEDGTNAGPREVRLERRPMEPKPTPLAAGHHCVFLNTYYAGFLDHHYQRDPTLAGASYARQHESLQAACFGDSDFYSTALRHAGWQASDIILNCRPLQQQWAKEQDVDPQEALLTIAVEQIKRLRPQVLYLQDLGVGTKAFLAAVRPYADLIVGQIASPVPPAADLDGFDLLISSFPHFVEAFRRQGRTAYYQPLAFEPRVLQKLGSHGRDIPLSFVGGLSPAHRERKKLLTALSGSLPLHVWGYGTGILEHQGVEASRLHGDAWGLDMFSVLARSVITVNHHIDVAEMNANNMRLFEATGCGALLVTDYKDNLSDLFDIGSEVVAYRSPDECRDLVSYFLTHQDEAALIAKRGQERTLHHHTYQARMRQTAEFLAGQLERKIGNHRLPEPDLNVSYGRTVIRPEEVTAELAQSWRSDLLPLKQRSLVQRELDDLYRGRPPVVFRVLAEALRPIVNPQSTILEIGCASGYYYEVLAYLLAVKPAYVGVDFSKAMIRMARTCYPQAHFEVGDGAALAFRDQSIPVVVSSCVLLHAQDYPNHIAEAARVALEHVVLHRTPVARRSPTRHFKKFAYGVETFELRFSESEILGLCEAAGLELRAALTYVEQADQDEFETTYVFATARSR